jgi:hypothetical protein
MREWCFLGLGVLAKQLRSWRKRMGVWRDRERERERERAGWEAAGRTRSAPEVHPDPSHGTKILGKMRLTMKAHEKSLSSKSKV